MQWIPVQNPWVVGQNQQWTQHSQSGENSSTGFQPNGSGWHQPETSSAGQGGNPYPGLQPGLYPWAIPATGSRLEPGDPLYTSTVDGPELRLISLQLTGPDNYNAWARDFRRALVTKEKDGFIDGTVPLPTDDRMRRVWRKCNQLVRTWIGNCIAPNVAAGLPPTEDPKKMWEDIREMYGKLDRAKLFSLTQAMTELKQGNLLVTACFNRLSALWNELESAEEELEGPETTLAQYRKIREREKVTRFLLILNESFSSFRSQILAMDPVPSLGRIYQLAVQEENQRLATAEWGRP